jgi:hypothetical protein
VAWTERLEKLDRRVVFFFMFIFVSIPILINLDMPVPSSVEVDDFYEAVDGLKEGDVVFFPADFDPGSVAELEPMMNSALQHLFRKNCRVVCFTLWDTGPGVVDRILRDAANVAGKQYGTDYVFLGFKAGREVVMVQIANSIANAFPQDYAGTPIQQLPLMQQVNRLADCKLIINISAGYPGTKEWVQQVRTRFTVPMVSGCTGVSAPEYYPYYQAGQLSGLLGGLGGAAKYETRVGLEGPATAGMPAQSMGHLAVILFVIMGNILYVINKRRRDAGLKVRS